MKNLSLIFLFLAPAFFQNCDAIEALKTIDLNGNIKKSYDVDITADDPSTISEVFTIDASNNAEMAKNLSKIEKYTIKSISYVVKNYSGVAGTTLNGHMNFGAISTDVTNLDLQAASTDQTVFIADISEANLTAISEDLKDGNSISGELEGLVSDKPVSFTVEATFNVDFRVGL